MTVGGRRFGYVIYTTAIGLPAGGITHIAKVVHMVDRKRQVDIPADQFGETSGTSAFGAREQMREKVEAWIAANDDSSQSLCR
jgi:hypothetical protein